MVEMDWGSLLVTDTPAQPPRAALDLGSCALHAFVPGGIEPRVDFSGWQRRCVQEPLDLIAGRTAQEGGLRLGLDAGRHCAQIQPACRPDDIVQSRRVGSASDIDA